MVSIHRPPGYEPGTLPLRHSAFEFGEPQGRFELPTFGLQDQRSAAELLRHR